MNSPFDRTLKRPCPRCGSTTKAGTCPRCAAAERLEQLDEGQPLDGTVRGHAEAAFDRSLDSIRIHTDATAASIARDEGAAAFAVGEHIGFDTGVYRPGTPIGDAVLAHEIAHAVQYDRDRGATEAAAPGAAVESDATQMAIDAGRHLVGGGPAPSARARVGLGLSRCDGESKQVKPVKGVAPALPAGKDYDIHTVSEYVKLWETQQGRKMTDEEKQTLRAGCIGITAVNLGRTTNPPLTECYGEFAQATKRREELEKSTGVPHFLFSKRFWSGGKDYTPAPGTGKVDMSMYDYKARPGWVNFDYGWYDDATGNMWHANEGGTDMEVYQSTPKEYAKPYGGFDTQVWCVGSIEKK